MFLPRVNAFGQARHPQPIAQGVFGMARTTGASKSKILLHQLVGTEATTETISFPVSSQA